MTLESRKSASSTRSGPVRRGGFTLAEALLASTVLAVVSASAALPFAAGIQQTNEATRLEQAVALGQALMEEILARPFFEVGERVASPGPGPDETTKNLYNNLDDFDGYAEVGGTVLDFDGTPLTDDALSGYTRQASVQYVSFAALGQKAADVNSFVHIQVRVYHNGTLLVTLDRIASRED